MSLPFTVERFLGVFEAYNRAVWPAQILLYSAGIGLVILGYRGRAGASRPIAFGLALLWAWMGGVYHLGFFRDINPAAVVFGIAFLLQAVLFIIWGLTARSDHRGTVTGMRAWLGGSLIAYALVAYPLLGWWLGHRYPASPTFGVPCPTTILTLGLFVWVRTRWWLLVVPIAWVLVGTSAALALGMREDLGLLAAGIAAVVWLRSRRAAGTTATA